MAKPVMGRAGRCPLDHALAATETKAKTIDAAGKWVFPHGQQLRQAWAGVDG